MDNFLIWMICVVGAILAVMLLVIAPLSAIESAKHRKEYRETHSCPDGLSLVFSRNGPICVTKPIPK